MSKDPGDSPDFSSTTPQNFALTFEQPAIGYSNFLLDSIHVICDYACEIYDNRMMTD